MDPCDGDKRSLPSPLHCTCVPGRRESALLIEDQFPVVDGADPTAILSLSSIGAAAASMTTPAMDTLNRLILVIRFLLWRQTAGDAALAAGLPGEAVRHYSKGKGPAPKLWAVTHP